jgi:TPR repeat protein
MAKNIPSYWVWNMKSSAKRLPKTSADSLFRRAEHYWSQGNVRAAFRCFLAAADAGDRSSQVNAGYFYDTGTGVRRNRSAAMYWYKRAYRRGDSSAAANIGTIWRDEKKFERALYWFRRAVELGDEDSNLEIANLYLRKEQWREAVPYLQRACQSDWATESTKEQAKKLLGRTLRLLKQH